MSKRKPHNEDAGYIAERRNPYAPGTVTIYEAEAQGIDVGGDRYAVVCNAHATISSDTSIKGARLSMKDPALFCDGCRRTQRVRERIAGMEGGDDVGGRDYPSGTGCERCGLHESCVCDE